MKYRIYLWLFLAALILPASRLSAAGLGSEARVYIPAGVQQLLSVRYQRLHDPAIQPLLSQILPSQFQSVGAIFRHGGIDPNQDVRRLDFAVYTMPHGSGLLLIAEGNFLRFQAGRFFQKTRRQPVPPQFQGITYYSSNGLDFFLPDTGTMVLGSYSNIRRAIDAGQGVISNLDANSRMSDLISGTQDTDVWSVLNSAGTRNVLQALAGTTGKMGSVLGRQFHGARYTLDFTSGVQLNLELITSDDLTAASLSTGLRAALLYREAREPSPMVKQLLREVEVDSAGSHVFLQVASTENQLAQLASSPLFKSIVR